MKAIPYNAKFENKHGERVFPIIPRTKEDMIKDMTFHLACRPCKHISWCNEKCKRWKSYHAAVKKLRSDQIAQFLEITKSRNYDDLLEIFNATLQYNQ